MNSDHELAIREAVQVAVEAIVGNLERVRLLVADAVTGLSNSFGSLEQVVLRERQLFTQINEQVRASGGSAFAAATAALLNDFMDQVIRVSHESMRMIERVEATSQHVDTVVTYANKIDSLARETRFLALNARIQTQKAGHAGRTFKVVADEVKRLASASADLSVRIRGEVSASHATLDEARQTAESLASRDLTNAIASRASIVEYIDSLDRVNTVMDDTLRTLQRVVVQAHVALEFGDQTDQLIRESIAWLHRLSPLLAGAASAVASDAEGASALCVQLHGHAAQGAVAEVEERLHASQLS